MKMIYHIRKTAAPGVVYWQIKMGLEIMHFYASKLGKDIHKIKLEIIPFDPPKKLR